jgi:purine-cytosine permease-like protein
VSEFNEMDAFINLLLKILSINGVISYLSYFYYKRRTTAELYNLKNESVFMALEFPLALSLILFFFILPIFTLAPFEIFFNKCE